ncbi:MAG: DUF2959 family protein [Bacteriovoracaceae bacterium]
MKTINKPISLFILLLLLFSCAHKKKENIITEEPRVDSNVVALGKREVFKDRVTNIREEQQNISDLLSKTRAQLLSIYGNETGQFDHQIDELNNSYETLKAQHEVAQDHISKLDNVASETFQKWEEDLKLISSEQEKRLSQGQLQTSKKDYQLLQRNLNRTQWEMSSILFKLGQQVNVFKRKRDKESIKAMKNSGGKIQSDMNDTIDNTSESIHEADRLIKTL